MQTKLNQIKLLENIISVPYQEKLEEVILNQEFPWFYNAETIYNKDAGDTSQFIHKILYDEILFDNNFYALLLPLIYNFEEALGLKFTEHWRIKANLLTKRSNTPYIHPPHVDINSSEYISIVYYVNETDGDTVIYDKFQNNQQFTNNEHFKTAKRVSPKRGSAIAFPSNQYHSSSLPNFNDARAVLNFVFKA